MTEDFTAKIALYHNLFLLCGGLFLLCLFVAVGLFFWLDIADVISYLTGRKAKKQIMQLEKDNAQGVRTQMPQQKAPQENKDGKRRRRRKKATDADSNSTEVLASTEAPAPPLPANDATEQLYGGAFASADQPAAAVGLFEVEEELLLVHTVECMEKGGNG